jgi:urease accessory protein UreH
MKCSARAIPRIPQFSLPGSCDVRPGDDGSSHQADSRGAIGVCSRDPAAELGYRWDMRPAVASVVVRGDASGSAVHRARPAGPLRLWYPRRPGGAAWIVAGNLGGGLVDGDDLALEVVVDRGATCAIATQSSTKVYRGKSCQRTTVQVGEGGAAIVAPDPVVPFRDAQFAQVTAVELAASASLVLIDTVTAGRVAHGERWSAARIDSALTIAIAGVPRLIDRLVLDRGTGAGDLAARMRRFDALATCVLLGPRAAACAAAALARLVRPPPRAPVVVAGSPLADGAVFRSAGERVDLVTAAARAVIGDACAALGAVPWQRRW